MTVWLPRLRYSSQCTLQPCTRQGPWCIIPCMACDSESGWMTKWQRDITVIRLLREIACAGYDWRGLVVYMLCPQPSAFPWNDWSIFPPYCAQSVWVGSFCCLWCPGIQWGPDQWNWWWPCWRQLVWWLMSAGRSVGGGQDKRVFAVFQVSVVLVVFVGFVSHQSTQRLHVMLYSGVEWLFTSLLVWSLSRWSFICSVLSIFCWCSCSLYALFHFVCLQQWLQEARVHAFLLGSHVR